MKKIELKLRKLLRTILGCISLTAGAFVFQACYGPLPEESDLFYNVKFTGSVKSQSQDLPIKGIKVTVNDERYSEGITDENGRYEFYASVPYYKNYVQSTPADSVKIHFFDIDGIESGYFVDETITIIIDPQCTDVAVADMKLKEK